MEKTIIAIGGGEIKNKTTLEIDRYVAELLKKKVQDRRANALFIGTASHDSMPYFNSFRKTYTSVFDIKVDVALVVYGEMNIDHIKEKFDKADCIYIGGGDTIFMLEKWREVGLDRLILDAYNSGKIICGLSAGAICWFTDMYTDYEIMRGVSSEYVLRKGLGIIDGTLCPHFNEREKDFTNSFLKSNLDKAYCVENDCALEFIDGKLNKVITSGGKAYIMSKDNGKVVKEEIAICK